MQPLVQAIVGLAHGLNLTATAEGVETAGELAVLQTLGCDQVQGYLLGRPAPAHHWENQWLVGRDSSPAADVHVGPGRPERPLQDPVT
jgi:EAL domain-containing protein (putative c-di-GMP-specific phosphodiesterase class I)